MIRVHFEYGTEKNADGRTRVFWKRLRGYCSIPRESVKRIQIVTWGGFVQLTEGYFKELYPGPNVNISESSTIYDDVFSPWSRDGDDDQAMPWEDHLVIDPFMTRREKETLTERMEDERYERVFLSIVIATDGTRYLVSDRTGWALARPKRREEEEEEREEGEVKEAQKKRNRNE